MKQQSIRFEPRQDYLYYYILLQKKDNWNLALFHLLLTHFIIILYFIFHFILLLDLQPEDWKINIHIRMIEKQRYYCLFRITVDK